MHQSWQPFLKEEFKQPYFADLSAFLRQAYRNGVVYPPKNQVFSAFATDLNAVKVVILGQDPYHGPRQAHGLAFSVTPAVAIPPSLRNIFQEIHTDTGRPIPTTGYLGRWAEQGVLLLNNVLTVEAGRAGSHRGRGWEIFTQHVITYLGEKRQHVVYLLWGRDARAKKELIDGERNLILEAAHPSPLSAYHGFFGCHPFSQCNDYLIKTGQTPIAW
ncbi:uracil-DNA glycosylase [bacterium]|nr:uracil-DNA glycosylase [bacterium]